MEQLQLIGEDTDLLVMLLYYAHGDTMALYSNQTEPNLMAVLKCMTSGLVLSDLSKEP